MCTLMVSFNKEVLSWLQVEGIYFRCNVCRDAVQAVVLPFRNALDGMRCSRSNYDKMGHMNAL